MFRSRRRVGTVSLLFLAYVIVGAFVAGINNYFQEPLTARVVVSALLAIFLWPLVLLGVDLRASP